MSSNRVLLRDNCFWEKDSIINAGVDYCVLLTGKGIVNRLIKVHPLAAPSGGLKQIVARRVLDGN